MVSCSFRDVHLSHSHLISVLICRFATTGCRAGSSCPFIHDPTKLQNNDPEPKARPRAGRPPGQDAARTEGNLSVGGSSSSLTERRRFVPPPVDGSRVVSKPVPKTQAEDPRDFQIKQVKRRFSPIEKAEDGGTSLAFSMVPSDPDFPFEMSGGLECVLRVPSSYPTEGRPTLEVKNVEMGREYQWKIEEGFSRLAERMAQGTLLSLMNSLDRQLEGLLGGEKEVEVTIIPNHVPGKSTKQLEPVKSVKPSSPSVPLPTRTSKPPDPYTPEQLRLARERREAETRQLEARLARTPLFSKSSDGIAYTVPITPRRHADLPVPLQAVKSIRLYVPLLYPLQHCRIELQDVSREAARVTETAFEGKAKENEDTTLMGHVNYLAQNIHVLATEIVEKPVERFEDPTPVDVDEPAVESKIDPAADDRSHIIIIPRPPEWAAQHDNDETSGSEYSDSYDSGDEDDKDGGAALETVPETSSSSAPERGISLSFPSLELYGIELLELVSLCITIKCERCKDTMDIGNLRHGANETHSCKKCAMPLGVSYRRELMHAHSFRAGYLDLEGCTVMDMLPSHFIPTCSECSTAMPTPGIVSVRAASTLAICRTCHRKLSFQIPEVKFLLISTSTRHNLAPVRKKPKESLGIVAGQELPRRGRCSHYGKSYRWFRFSCCAKVFPCDRCHDEGSEHPNEHANRMICGFCSREQNYRPDDCGVCHADLVKKAGSGFWEGGKGTRDKGRMSRKGACVTFLFSIP